MPDFGIMRGFNEKLFGDKLVAGQLPTQLGLIGSQEVADFDADSVAFFGRVTTAGGSLSATEKAAVNQLVLDLKANSLWTPMKAIYPMVGASAAACAQNLKSSSFTGTFSSGWTFASTGVTGNGTSAYFDTGLNENTEMSLTSCNIGLYTPTNYQTGLNYDMGLYDGGNQLTSILFYNNETYFRSMNLAGGNPAPTSIAGFWQNNRTGTNVTKTIFNNTIRNVQNNVPNGKTNLNYYLGALNVSGSAAGFGLNTYSFTHICDGLTDTQASNFYTAVQAFQTTLSRQV